MKRLIGLLALILGASVVRYAPAPDLPGAPLSRLPIAQYLFAGYNPGAVAVNITLDTSCAKDNGTTSATSVACGPMTPTAGDAITCELKVPYSASNNLPISVTDNVNSGKYNVLIGTRTDFNFDWATYLFENAAASATTITASWTTSAAHGAMSCQAWKGVPTKYSADSTIVESRAATSTNPCTTATCASPDLTPFDSNRVIVAALDKALTGLSAGTNYTIVNQNVSSTWTPEYWIQTTKTATNAPYQTSTSSAFYDSMGALAPSQYASACSETMIFDWTGGTNGNTVAEADMEAGTKGGHKQANATAYTGNADGSWTFNGATTGLTYATANYQPLSTTRTCPFYTGSGTGTVGLNYSTTQAAHSAQYNFETTASLVSAGICFSTDIAAADNGGPTDSFTIYGNSGFGTADFATFGVNGNGTLYAYLETSSATNATHITLTSGNWYWVWLQYQQGSSALLNHTMKVYSFSGAGCQGTPTLLNTLQNAIVANNSFPNRMIIGTSAQTTTVGKNLKYAAGFLDLMYGSLRLP